jgi:hypothetical protein
MDAWPRIPYRAWRDTCTNLHLRTQIVGKIRLAQTPWINHSWHVTLYVSGRGLTTGPIPCGERSFQIDFDFVDQQLSVQVNDGRARSMPLVEQTVADFHGALFELLGGLDLDVRINRKPNEVSNPIRFDEDREHRAYDAAAVERFWRALLQIDRVFTLFRSGYLGKVSPVHFFWGSFDLVVTRFSGRRAPFRGGGTPGLPDAVVKEAYSHEVSSAGFWPGGAGVDDAAFYSYAYPEPEGFSKAPVKPRETYYHEQLGMFILPYEVVRTAASPDQALMSFLQSTYDAAADLGHWERAALECATGVPGVPRRL